MRPLKQRWMGADLDRLKCSFKKFAMDSVASNAIGTGEADALYEPPKERARQRLADEGLTCKRSARATRPPTRHSISARRWRCA